MVEGFKIKKTSAKLVLRYNFDALIYN